MNEQDINKIDRRIETQIISWRNQAIPNQDIIKKLVKEYNLSEEEAATSVKYVHTQQYAQERKYTEKHEKMLAKQRVRNAFSAPVIIGILLILGGLTLTIFSEGNTIFYGAIVSGFVSILIGLGKE